MAKGHFGPAVIGEEAFASETEYVLEHREVFGPAVLDPTPNEAIPLEKARRLALEGGKNEPGPAVKDAVPVALSAKDATKMLAANPLEVDAIMRAEFSREDGMRVTVLKALLAAENERPGPDGSKAPRAEVIDALDYALTPKEEAPEEE